MKRFAVAASSAVVVAAAASTGYHGARRAEATRSAQSHAVTLTNARLIPVISPRRSELSNEALNGVIRNTCGACHNDGLKIGKAVVDPIVPREWVTGCFFNSSSLFCSSTIGFSKSS